MEYKFSITLDKEYFSNCYNESIRYGSKWRKYEFIIGGLFLIAGFTLFAYTHWKLASPIIFILIGFYEVFSPIIKKPFWVRRQTSSKISGSKVDIIVNDDGIVSKSPNSESNINWSEIEKVTKTPNGILVWPQKSVHLFFPKIDIGEEGIEYILNRV